MKTNKELLTEFLTLGLGTGKSWVRREEDTPIRELVFVRFGAIGITVHYMYNGTYLFIPSRWMDLFGNFFVHSGAQVAYNRPMETGDIDDMIYWMTELQRYTLSSLPSIDPVFLDLLGNICDHGTGGLRKMLKDEYDISIDPFEYHSPMKTIRL